MPSDHGLADLGGLGDAEVLRARAMEALQRLGTDNRAFTHYEGTDSSDSVWVTIDHGGDVIDVSVSRRWPERMSDDSLGEAVLAAYVQAQEMRAVASAAMRQPDDSVEPAVWRPAAAAPDIDDERWSTWVWESLGEARRKLDRLGVGRPVQPPDERTIQSPAGYARIRAVGQSVTAVLIDAPQVARHSPDRVAADLKATFAQVRSDQ